MILWDKLLPRAESWGIVQACLFTSSFLDHWRLFNDHLSTALSVPFVYVLLLIVVIVHLHLHLILFIVDVGFDLLGVLLESDDGSD